MCKYILSLYDNKLHFIAFANWITSNRKKTQAIDIPDNQKNLGYVTELEQSRDVIKALARHRNLVADDEESIRFGVPR